MQGTHYKRREGMEQVQLVAWSRHSVRYVRGRATCTYVQCTHVQSGQCIEPLHYFDPHVVSVCVGGGCT